jgi:16S rRNA (guanine1207-N2)-methyltransferase
VSEHYFSSSPTSDLQKGLIKTSLRGREYTFLTASGLFSHKRIDNGTRLLVESMKIPEIGSMLDLGCGIGVIGIVAACENNNLDVMMSDVNPRAVMIAGENIKRMELRNVKVFKGYLYDPFKGMIFDTIVSNPPVSAGMSRVVKPIVIKAPEYLKKGGTLQLVIQSQKGANILSQYLEKAFGNYEVLSRSGGFRVLYSIKD